MTKRMLVFTCRIAAAAAARWSRSPRPPPSPTKPATRPTSANLIKGQEDYVYVWTLGVEGLGDGSDKLVTVDVNPKSKTYGKVLHQVSVGARGEAHHMGFTDDRRQLWAGGLAGSNDLRLRRRAPTPRSPKLVKTITDLAGEDRLPRPAHLLRAAGPHARPGALQRRRTRAASPAWRVYNNKGEFIAQLSDAGRRTAATATATTSPSTRRRTCCSPRASPATRTTCGRSASSIKDAEAMKSFGNTMVVWDLKAMKPKQVLQRARARRSRSAGRSNPGDNWAITAAALTSKLWLVKQDADGAVAGEGSRHHRRPGEDPAARGHQHHAATARALGQHVHGRHDALLRPLQPARRRSRPTRSSTGKQVNMISQSWDGKRVYITSSLLANWDKGGADNEQFLRGFKWDGKELKPAFEVDFTKEKLGRAHHMKLGSKVAAHRLCRAERPLARAAGPSWLTRAAPCSSVRLALPAARARRAGRARRRPGLRAAGAGNVPASPHHAGARRAGADGGRAPRQPLAVHARADHAARLHLHDLHRPRGLPARVSGLRPAEGRDPGDAGAAPTRCSS